MRMLRFVLLAGISSAVWGQAMVEYGLGVAAAGAAGAPGKAASRGIAGIFSNLQKTLSTTTEAATAPAPSPAAQPAQTAAPAKRSAAARQPQKSAIASPAAKTEPAEPPKPAVVYEDPAGITAGLDRAELLARFGEPAMKITTSGGESMTYQAKERTYEVEVRGGKVASVQGKSRPKQSAVVILR